MGGRESAVNRKEKEGRSYALAQIYFFLRGQKSIDVIASIDVVRSVPFRTVLRCCFVLCSKRVKAHDLERMLCNIERQE
jgi:hypothetical protein